MVLCYYCKSCGFQDSCEIAGEESDYVVGERLCPSCGDFISGVNGESRDGHEYSGDINWVVFIGVGESKDKSKVLAHDHQEAIEKVHKEIEDSKIITGVYPK